MVKLQENDYTWELGWRSWYDQVGFCSKKMVMLIFLLLFITHVPLIIFVAVICIKKITTTTVV